MAVAEGYLARNPAALLFTPKETRHSVAKRMTTEEVRLLFSVLEARELLIAKLAIVAGMRPGEIFGLKWEHIKEDHIHVQQRIYRGKIDSPKTTRSVREVALSEGLQCLLSKWKSTSVDSGLGAWVFPSEKMTTPVSKDNCWRRHMAPKLNAVGLGWVNFQVMRRTHSSLKDNKVDTKVVADQLGHSLDVNLNVYTQTALSVRKQAVNTLESALEQPSNPGEVLRVM
jgi:integrase